MICTSCGRENPDDVSYCLDCGRKLDGASGEARARKADGVVCSRCGGSNAAGMNFCKRCGAPLGRDEARSEPEARDEGSLPARVCDRCKGVLDKDARFCKYCGNKLEGSPERDPAPASAPLEGDKTGPLGSAPPPSPSTKACLIAILKDGSEGQRYNLDSATNVIGRKEGEILLTDDPYLSPRHAKVTAQGGKYFIKDLVSTNGVFVSIREPVRIHHGDVILIGQQVLRFEALEDAEQGLGPASQHGTLLFGTPEGSCLARLCQITTEGICRDVYHVRAPQVILGREGRDIVFPDDPFMSRRHAKMSYDSGSRSFTLEDLGSFNGTSIRFRGERELHAGDRFRVGNHLFRFELTGVGS